MNIIESNKIELKSKYNDQLVREIVAFINADGGKIYIGIENDGTVIGAEKIDETLRRIADIVTTQKEPIATDIVTTEIQIMEGKPIIVISIKKGINPIYCIKKYGFSSVGAQ